MKNQHQGSRDSKRSRQLRGTLLCRLPRNRIQRPLSQVELERRPKADGNIGGLLFQLSRYSSAEGIPTLFYANFALGVMPSRANAVHNFAASAQRRATRRCSHPMPDNVKENLRPAIVPWNRVILPPWTGVESTQFGLTLGNDAVPAALATILTLMR